MNMTLEQLDTFLEQWEELYNAALPVCNALIEMEEETFNRSRIWFPDAEDIYIRDGEICANYELDWGCGEYETRTITCPTKFLFDDDAFSKYKEEKLQNRKLKAEEEKRKAAKIKLETAEKNRKAKEERDHKKYLELKAKFGDQT